MQINLRAERLPSMESSFSMVHPMKALVYEGAGRMTLADKPKPEWPAPSGAMVRVTLTIIFGTDLYSAFALLDGGGLHVERAPQGAPPPTAISSNSVYHATLLELPAFQGECHA